MNEDPSETRNDITIDAQDVFRFILRGALLALVVAGAVAFGVFQLSRRQQPVYRAEATVLAAQTTPDLRQFGLTSVVAPPLDVSAYRVAGRSAPVLQEAVAALNGGTADASAVRQLRGSIDVEVEDQRTSSLIYIQAEAGTPSVAAARANAVAEALVAWDRARARESLSQVITTLEQQIAGFTEQIRSRQALGAAADQSETDGLIRLRAEQQQQLSNARALSASAMPLLAVLQPADVPRSPVSPRPLLDAAVAGVLAVVLVYGVLLLLRALDTRLRDVEDLARAGDLPVVAEFPRAARGNNSVLREASNYLQTNLLFSTADAHPKVFLITSAQDQEGKSTIAAALAEGFVRNGSRTLLVDADLRDPSVAKNYRIPNVKYHTTRDWLQDPTARYEVVEVSMEKGQSLYVIPEFQAAPQGVELLNRGFRGALDQWREHFDVIIVDSAPILAVADSLAIAPFCTGTVLVVDQQRTDRRQLRTSVQLLRRLGVRILGLAANNVTRSDKGTISYGYGYGSDPNATAIRNPAGAKKRS